MIIRYSVKLAEPAAHVFHIRCYIANPDPGGQVVSLPAWIPGSYLIRNFAKNIVAINAQSVGKNLSMQPLDKDSWRCAPCESELLIEYQVYGWDTSVRSAHFDQTHAFFNGTSVFLRVHGQEQQACQVELLPPEFADNWQVATSLSPLTAQPRGFGWYQAADYDELIDHPVEIGQLDWLEFSANGIPHTVAVYGSKRFDAARLKQDLKSICEYQLNFFAAPAPFTRYLFSIMVVGEGNGGLEHRNSCRLLCTRNSLPISGTLPDNTAYQDFLGLCSHEYFHSWNVKRIKPAAFMPYDLTRENYTELLWVFEGFTSYYDDLILLRSGLIKPEQYLIRLAETITRVQRTPGRHRQTVLESSFYAWTKFYQQDENSVNSMVSYYAKGALIALCLDLQLRQRTAQRCSLDQVMQQLWQRYGQTGQGVPEPAVEALIIELVGMDFAASLNAMVRSTGDLPLAEVLTTVGVKLNWRSAAHPSDKGGTNLKDLPAAELGVVTQISEGRLFLKSVYTNSAAQQAGLSAGDELVAIDQLQIKTGNLITLLRMYQPGDRVTVHAFRRDELLEFNVTLQAASQTTAWLTIDKEATQQQQAARQHWLQCNYPLK